MATDLLSKADSSNSNPSKQSGPGSSLKSIQHTRSSSGWKIVTLLLLIVGIVAAVAYAKLAPPDKGSTVKALTHRIALGDLVVSVKEDGVLESSSNTEIKCKVRGGSTVLWVVESGTQVKPGDELVRMDTSTIEDNINQQKITYQNALATFAQSESDVAVAEISITEYLEGTYRTELQTALSNVAISEENLRVAQNVLSHSERMFRKGYVSELELDGNSYSVEHAKLELELMKTQVDALKRFTKAKQLKELESTLVAKKAKLESDKAALDLEKSRLERAEKQLEKCVSRAEKPGMVIYPSAAEWKEQPDIEEGASVREDQVLLIIPDLSDMQVKIGIHESKIERLAVGLPAKVQLQDTIANGQIDSYASVARPAGWWTGNAVKYDTTIKLANVEDLKPGMSAQVEVFFAQHKQALTIPVAAVVQLDDGFCCWVETASDPEKRKLELGDTNDQYMVVKSGVEEGDLVILNPRAHIEEAKSEAWKPQQVRNSDVPDVGASKGEADSKAAAGKKGATKSGKKPAKKTANGAAVDRTKQFADAVMKKQDANKDGVLTEDEFDERTRKDFGKTDLNSDGKVDMTELVSALKKLAEKMNAGE